MGVTRSAIVVGGGIGGLAAAAGLLHAGWRMTVIEQAPAFTEVGAGISLWPSTIQALEMLGVRHPSGAELASALGLDLRDLAGGIKDWRGRCIVRAPNATTGRDVPTPVVVHRAELLDVMLLAVPAECRIAGVQVHGVRMDGDRPVVSYDGGEMSADLVVGADGIGSTVRRTMWPDAPEPTYSGRVVLRAVMPTPAVLQDAGQEAWAETWGPGSVVGLAPMSHDRVYVYATATRRAPPSRAELEALDLRRAFSGWCHPIPEVLEAISADRLIQDKLHHLPPLNAYTRGSVALLGDAAHAMTPSLGQGGGQAIEDAATLVRLLQLEPAVDAALARYDAERRPRASGIASRSLQTTRISHLRSGPARWLRDGTLRLIPSTVLDSAVVETVTWIPPAIGPATAGSDRRAR